MNKQARDAKIQELQRRRDAWMAQRQIAKEQKEVESELARDARADDVVTQRKSQASAGRRAPLCDVMGHGNRPAYSAELYTDKKADFAVRDGFDVAPEKILDRLTEKLSVRLRDELKQEIIKENMGMEKVKQDIGRRMESYLASEIESQHCAVCYELMEPPARQPILLFPCGHTFCRQCIDAHERNAKGKSKCPYCREAIQSRAPNIQLQQIIASFVSRRDAIDSGEIGKDVNRVAADVIEEHNEREAAEFKSAVGARRLTSEERVMVDGYIKQHRTLAMRCRVLKNEQQDTVAQDEELDRDIATSQIVVEHLRSEENEIKKKMDKLQKELDLVQAHISQQQNKIGGIEATRHAAGERAALIDKTIGPLQSEMEKVVLLIQNFIPDYNDELE